MSTAVLSFFTPDYQPLHDVNGPVKDAYCAKHGYCHIVRNRPYRADPGYYAYDRLAYIRDLFFGNLPEGRDVDVILCLNGHAQIMTHTITVESLLEDGKDFYIAADVNGLNAGVFILRKSEWLRTWLDRLLEVEPEYTAREWKEQNAMTDNREKPEFAGRIKVMDQWLLNSYDWAHYNWPTTTPGQFIPGRSFILHIPGRSVRHPEPTPLVLTRVKLFSSPEIRDQIVWD